MPLNNKTIITLIISMFLSIFLGTSLSYSATDSKGKMKGKVMIDGSSTVFPITEAIAEEFREVQPRVRVNIGVSGTGGGFKKFVAGEIDINDASRPIKSKEASLAKEKNISYLELPVAYDGITIVVNKANTWAESITVAELTKIWDRGSSVSKWSDIRAEWPDRKIKLYGPGADSGTFDYFTEAINGKSGRTRSEYTKSEDDNLLVKGISGDIDALGYFGFAYYKENMKILKAVKIDGIEPTEITINNGTYKPLSRPVYIYLSNSAVKKSEVNEFVKFYLEKAGSIVSEVGYIPLPKKIYEESLKKLEALTK